MHSYLSCDRPEIQVECRDLARKLQQPSHLDEMGLKRLARYLGVRPRLVWLFRWQKRVTRIESWCDTDHAGCTRTKKSVPGCALMLGSSTVCTYCKDHAVIALSSVLWASECDVANVGPSEYSLGLGMESQSPCVDGCHSGNYDWKPMGGSDGHGGQDLAWKETHKEMLADLSTKHVDAATMLNCVTGLGLRSQSGESKLTLKA